MSLPDYVCRRLSPACACRGGEFYSDCGSGFAPRLGADWVLAVHVSRIAAAVSPRSVAHPPYTWNVRETSAWPIWLATVAIGTPAVSEFQA